MFWPGLTRRIRAPRREPALSIANYLELELLDHITGVGAYTAPTNIYVKLHSGDPGEAGTSNAATETTRKVVTFTGPAAAGSIASDADVQWTSVAATETYSHASLWDASSGGNCLWTGAFSSSSNVTAGDTFTISAGNLTLSLD